MNDSGNRGGHNPPVDELEKEIRTLKRNLSLAEINLTRARMISASQDRVETIWNNALNKELQFFQLVLENTTNILLLLDFDGRFAYASDVFLRNAGIINFGLINGRHFRDVLEPLIPGRSLNRFSEAVDKAGIQKKTVSLEEQIDFNFRGTPRIFSILITPMIEENGKITGTMALFSDITEMKNALEAANNANNAKSAFLAKMSHEIRTPMNAIIGMTELIRREDIPPAVRGYILTIEQAGSNLLSIINDILDFSKIESGKLEIVPEEYLFSSLINDVISIIRTKVLESRLEFLVYVDSNIPNSMYGDITRIRQIMLNILSNAVKYTQRGYISLSVTGETTGQDSVSLVIKVTDTGKGIRQEDIAKLFDEFTRLDAKSNMSVEGTGLGLAITQSLVKAMGGTVDVNSVYGKGSTFTVTLPQKVMDSRKLAVVENAKEKKVLVFAMRDLCISSFSNTLDGLGVDYKLVSTEDEFYKGVMSREYPFVFISSVLYEKIKKKYSGFGSDIRFLLITDFGETIKERNISSITTPVFSIPVANFLNGVTEHNNFNSDYGNIIRFTAPDARILIVDDLKTNLKVAEGLMQPYGMQVDVCNAGSTAIEMIKTNYYDVVFMDHMMPEMDGIEATAFIRELGAKDEYYKKLPIVALTANAVTGIREMFLANNFNDFLTKPIDTLGLNTVLEKWIPKEKQISFTGDKSAQAAVDKNYKSQGFGIEGLDTGKGISMSGGLLDNYFDTLSVFYRDGLEKLAEIAKCLEAHDLLLYTIHVHGLKSAAALIGADELSKMAYDLEMAGERGDMAFINAQNPVFLQALESLLRSINCVISQVKTEAVLEPAALKPKLTELKTALSTLDAGTMNSLVESLLKQTRATNAYAPITQIADKILISEYDEAAALIESLMQD
ncbi:MAG: ATP-binding protein [Treponema sp.]|nr:ATP-binding protein [Treponema sp.]